MERDLDALALWCLGFVIVLLIGWTGFALTASAWSHERQQLRLACEAGRAGLTHLQDSLFLEHAPGCR